MRLNLPITGVTHGEGVVTWLLDHAFTLQPLDFFQSQLFIFKLTFVFLFRLKISFVHCVSFAIICYVIKCILLIFFYVLVASVKKLFVFCIHFLWPNYTHDVINQTVNMKNYWNFLFNMTIQDKYNKSTILVPLLQ